MSPMRRNGSAVRTMMVAFLALAALAAQAQEGITKTSIVLGQSVALTGPGSLLDNPLSLLPVVYKQLKQKKD